MLVTLAIAPNNKNMDTSISDESLKNQLLIAMPSIQDGIFANSVTYICEHNEHGAMGIVINHPLDLMLDEILDHFELCDQQHPHREHILAGGPVHMDRGFVLHSKTMQHWDSTLEISEQISLTTSQDILSAIAHNQGPQDSLIALGYAGWGAGQLEYELADNAWLTAPANSDIIFKTHAPELAKVAAAQLGIDLSLMTGDAGHC